MKTKIVVFSCAMALAVFVFISSYYLPPFFFQPLGGDEYARVVSILLFFSLVVWIITQGSLKNRVEQNLQMGEKELTEWEEAGKAEAGAVKKREPFVIKWFAIITILYAFSVFTIGYFVSTFVFLFISMLLIAGDWKKRWIFLLLITCIASIVLFFLFRIVHIYLPPALLF